VFPLEIAALLGKPAVAPAFFSSFQPRARPFGRAAGWIDPFRRAP
jgi:hypothetical protein